MAEAGRLRFAPGVNLADISRLPGPMQDRDNYVEWPDGAIEFGPDIGDRMRSRRREASDDLRTIRPVPGYPAAGPTRWRDDHDQVILGEVARHNRMHGYLPGDPLYWTPDRLKAQAMIEAGGSGHADIFAVDPWQVNNPWDWAKEKARIGLRQGQVMTPQSSARGALDWLDFKASDRKRRGASYDARGALYDYNGATYRRPDPNREHRDWYADEVLRLERLARRTPQRRP